MITQGQLGLGIAGISVAAVTAAFALPTAATGVSPAAVTGLFNALAISPNLASMMAVFGFLGCLAGGALWGSSPYYVPRKQAHTPAQTMTVVNALNDVLNRPKVN